MANSSASLIMYLFIFLCLMGICIGDNDVQSVKVNVDGEVSNEDNNVIDSKLKSKTVTSLDKDLDPTERMEQKVEALYAQIMELQSTVVKQQDVIKNLNETLQTFVFTSKEYGVIYEDTDDRPLLPISAHSHDVPFVMLNVISIRLPKKDAIYTSKNKKDRKKKGRGRSLTKTSGSKRTRFIHVIATLSRDGIFQLWDDEQNELYTYFDSNILMNTDTAITDKEGNEMTDDELVNANKNFVVYSDAVTETKYGNTWFVVARNDASWIKIYAIAAWRDYVNDKVNDKIRKSIISGHIVPENTIYRPTNKEIDTMKKEAKKKKKKPYRMSASKRARHEKNREKEDVNEFDADDTDSSNKDTNECKEGDKECSAKIAKSADETKEGETSTEKEEGEEDVQEEDVLDTKNATVSGVAVYQYQKKKYILVAYSDGKVFSYKPNGKLASSSSTVPYQAPNKTIVAVSTTKKKYEMLVVTDAGFQFLKLPKLSKFGPFCTLPPETTINSINFDAVATTIMYLGTTDGRIIVYNTKKLNKKMCKSLDSFTVHPDSPLKIETLPGYLLITSSQGMHVYNVTKKKAAPYDRPGLVYVKSFEDEFGSNDNPGSNVMVSSYTDNQQRTVIAYAQSATNVSVEDNENDKDVSYKFVVLESYLPSFKPEAMDKGGIMGIISKAPLFVGIAMFAFFWVFMKGGKGQSASFANSPLGRLGKIFGGGRRGRTSSRGGGSRDINAKMNRLQNKHGGALGGGGRMPSKNMRYTQQTARRSSSGRSGSTYRSTLGRRDFSD